MNYFNVEIPITNDNNEIIQRRSQYLPQSLHEPPFADQIDQIVKHFCQSNNIQIRFNEKK